MQKKPCACARAPGCGCVCVCVPDLALLSLLPKRPFSAETLPETGAFREKEDERERLRGTIEARLHSCNLAFCSQDTRKYRRAPCGSESGSRGLSHIPLVATHLMNFEPLLRHASGSSLDTEQCRLYPLIGTSWRRYEA